MAALEEHPAGGGLARGGPGRNRGRTLEFAGLTGSTPQPPRYKSGIAEFDRVCGGGLVVGSALLIGGDPGIGKSRLTAEFARDVYDKDATVLFGRCYEENVVPYQPFVEAVEQYLQANEGQEVPE